MYIHMQFELTEVARPFLLRPGNEAKFRGELLYCGQSKGTDYSTAQSSGGLIILL